MSTSKAIFASVICFCITTVICIYLYINKNNIIIDKYTNCLSVAMSESRQSGKVIDIDKAQAICDRLK